MWVFILGTVVKSYVVKPKTKKLQYWRGKKKRRKIELGWNVKPTINSNTTWISVLAMLIIIASFVSIGGVIVAWRVMDDDGERHQRPDKHTSALGRLFFRRKKEGHVIVPYQPLEAPSPASAQDAGVGPVILEE